MGADLEVVRRLVRDQWVRAHGTPRITVIAGDTRAARRAWNAWVTAAGIAGEAALFEISECVTVEAAVHEAIALATHAPRRPIAVIAPAELITGWRHGRDDRTSAMVDEGLVIMAARDGITTAAGAVDPCNRTETPGHPLVAVEQRLACDRDAMRATPADLAAVAGRNASGKAHTVGELDARSLAELTLFEALEATPATAGRFELNAYLAAMFGGRAAEIDLLSRTDRLAVEIDGYHHFGEPAAYRRDRRKDLLLQGQGLLVLRLLADDVLADARAAVGYVVEAMAIRIAMERG